MNSSVALSFIKLSPFLHQEDASARFLCTYELNKLTGVVGVLLELSHPGFADEDSLFLGIFVADLEAVLLRFFDNGLHVLLSHGAQDAEEKVPFGQLPRELLLCRQIL